MLSFIGHWRRPRTDASAHDAGTRSGSEAGQPLQVGNGEFDWARGLRERPALRIVKRANGTVHGYHTHGGQEVRLRPDSKWPAQGSIRVVYRCPSCIRLEPMVMLRDERAE